MFRHYRNTSTGSVRGLLKNYFVYDPKIQNTDIKKIIEIISDKIVILCDRLFQVDEQFNEQDEKTNKNVVMLDTLESFGYGIIDRYPIFDKIYSSYESVIKLKSEFEKSLKPYINVGNPPSTDLNKLLGYTLAYVFGIISPTSFKIR